MGSFFSSFWSKLFDSTHNFNILIVGLANAGKTTLLYQMQKVYLFRSLNKAVDTSPTIGSNVEEIAHKNVRLSAWDLGGQERLRSIWSTYYTRTHAVLFVIDSTNRKDAVISKAQLFKIVIDQALKNVPILVLANKQDLKEAMSEEEMTMLYSLHQIKNHSWKLQGCSALQGSGIKQALDWLTEELLSKR